MHLKSIALIACSLVTIGCSDKEAQVQMYDKNISKLPCLSLSNQSRKLDLELSKLYEFDKSCRYKLYLDYKSDIVCNSGYNAATKTFSNFPTAYIKLEIKDGLKTLYSYYKDLNSPPDKEDLKDGVSRIKRDLLSR